MSANNQLLSNSSYGNNSFTQKPHNMAVSSTFNLTPDLRRLGQPCNTLSDSAKFTNKKFRSLENKDNQQPSTNNKDLGSQSTFFYPNLNYQPIYIPKTYSSPSNPTKSVDTPTKKVQLVTPTSFLNKMLRSFKLLDQKL